MWKESFHLIPHGKGSSYNKIIQKTFRKFLLKNGRKQLFSKKILQRKGRRNNETLNFCFIHFIFLIATIPFIFVLYIYILYVLINGFQLHLNQINSYRAKYFLFLCSIYIVWPSKKIVHACFDFKKIMLSLPYYVINIPILACTHNSLSIYYYSLPVKQRFQILRNHLAQTFGFGVGRQRRDITSSV